MMTKLYLPWSQFTHILRLELLCSRELLTNCGKKAWIPSSKGFHRHISLPSSAEDFVHVWRYRTPGYGGLVPTCKQKKISEEEVSRPTWHVHRTVRSCCPHWSENNIRYRWKQHGQLRNTSPPEEKKFAWLLANPQTKPQHHIAPLKELIKSNKIEVDVAELRNANDRHIEEQVFALENKITQIGNSTKVDSQALHSRMQDLETDGWRSRQRWYPHGFDLRIHLMMSLAPIRKSSPGKKTKNPKQTALLSMRTTSPPSIRSSFHSNGKYWALQSENPYPPIFHTNYYISLWSSYNKWSRKSKPHQHTH